MGDKFFHRGLDFTHPSGIEPREYTEKGADIYKKGKFRFTFSLIVILMQVHAGTKYCSAS